MRAAVLRSHGTTPEYADHPDPAPAEGSSLVRVTAAPVAPLDLLCATGTSYFGRRATPYVPGVQGVGEVLTSASVAPGIRVFFPTSAGMVDVDGSLAELCVVPTVDLVPLETEVPDTTVAALGLSAVAAWMALSWRAELRPGERVVVLGAGGAVGQAAIGAAHVLGASRVVAVCRPGAAVDRARDRGADAVVPLPVEPDAGALVAALTDALDGQADLVLDPVFGWVAAAATQVLAAGGRLVNLGGSAGDGAEFSSAGLRGRSLSLLGYTNNAIDAAQRAEALRSILGHAEQGRIAVEHRVRPLADVSVVWEELAVGSTYVRQVLVP